MTTMKFEVGDAVHGPSATIVKMWCLIDDNETIEVSGEALRHPDDKNDEELATLLAHGRALESMGNKLQKRARGLVRHNDHLAALKAKQKRSKAARGRLPSRWTNSSVELHQETHGR